MVRCRTRSSSGEELRLTLRVTQTTGPVRTQRTIVSVDLNKKKSMAFDPALPALRALPGQGLFQNISFVPPHCSRKICNSRVVWQCRLRRQLELTRQIPRWSKKRKGRGWRRRKHDVVGFHRVRRRLVGG